MIGVFDSGLGGLTVLREIHAHLPSHDLFYLGDTAYLPYGTKSPDEVCERALWCGHFLVEQGAEAVVIACNTASACAQAYLERELKIPIIGVIDPLLERLEGTRIGLLATPTTIHSQVYQQRIAQILPHAEVTAVEAPQLVALVESGAKEDGCIANILLPFHQAQIDTLILGCTHFPLLKNALAAELPGVTLLDSSAPCAQRVKAWNLPLSSGAISYHFTSSPLAPLELSLDKDQRLA